MPADRPVKPAAKPTARSRVSNGNRLFSAADGRSKHARRFRDLYRDLLEQTGGRHEVLIRSVAGLCVRREEIESCMARGEVIDTAELVSLAGAISRIMTKVGLTDADDDGAGTDGTQAAIAALRANRQPEAQP